MKVNHPLTEREWERLEKHAEDALNLARCPVGKRFDRKRVDALLKALGAAQRLAGKQRAHLSQQALLKRREADPLLVSYGDEADAWLKKYGLKDQYEKRVTYVTADNGGVASETGQVVLTVHVYDGPVEDAKRQLAFLLPLVKPRALGQYDPKPTEKFERWRAFAVWTTRADEGYDGSFYLATKDDAAKQCAVWQVLQVRSLEARVLHEGTLDACLAWLQGQRRFNRSLERYA